MTTTQYEQTHLAGVLALCEAEEWPTFPAKPEHRRCSGFRIYLG